MRFGIEYLIGNLPPVHLVLSFQLGKVFVTISRKKGLAPFGFAPVPGAPPGQWAQPCLTMLDDPTPIEITFDPPIRRMEVTSSCSGSPGNPVIRGVLVNPDGTVNEEHRPSDTTAIAHMIPAYDIQPCASGPASMGLRLAKVFLHVAGGTANGVWNNLEIVEP